jgi:hypothetical protein
MRVRGGRLLGQPPGSTRASGALRETEIKRARANPPLHKHSGPLHSGPLYGVVASYAYRTGGGAGKRASLHRDATGCIRVSENTPSETV